MAHTGRMGYLLIVLACLFGMASVNLTVNGIVMRSNTRTEGVVGLSLAAVLAASSIVCFLAAFGVHLRA